MQFGRSLQGLRVVLGGRYARAQLAGCRRSHHLRYGRSYSTANLAIHPAVCQENSRSAAGRGTIENQEHTRRESTVRVQHGVRSV